MLKEQVQSFAHKVQRTHDARAEPKSYCILGILHACIFLDPLIYCLNCELETNHSLSLELKMDFASGSRVDCLFEAEVDERDNDWL